VLLVATAVGSAVALSIRTDTRYEAVAGLVLQVREPGVNIDREVRAELPRIARRRGLDPTSADVAVVARFGDPRVQVVVSAPAPEGLVFVANTYASELVAWDRGPAQIAVHDRYFRAARDLAGARSGDPGAAARKVRDLRKEVVSDADYRAATDAERVAGPQPIERGMLAFAVGLFVAVAVVVGLDALDRRPEAPSHA
jgi:hypothetical protein